MKAKDRRRGFRLTQEEEGVIGEAAALCGMTFAGFVRDWAVERARESVDARRGIALSSDACARFLEALDAPPQRLLAGLSWHDAPAASSASHRRGSSGSTSVTIAAAALDGWVPHLRSVARVGVRFSVAHGGKPRSSCRLAHLAPRFPPDSAESWGSARRALIGGGGR
ncbi:MAG: DUF1778 domain-containing protein [Egibacteraceae bacterium]